MRQIIFSYMWRGNKQHGRIPLISWETASKPKDLGKWGIKHILHFLKSFVAKGGWKLITKKGIWQNILFHKYISPKSIKEWVKSPNRKVRRGSNFWKALIEAFSIINSYLCRKVGNGHSIKLCKLNGLENRQIIRCPKFFWKI